MMILVQSSTELKGQREWTSPPVCTGIWSVGVVHTYLGTKLVAPNYFQYPMWGFCHVFPTPESQSRGLLRGAITKMLLRLAVSYFGTSFVSSSCVRGIDIREDFISFSRDLVLSAFGRFFCLVGLDKMGKGNWLDGSAGCQLATCIYGTRGYLAESVQGHFPAYLSQIILGMGFALQRLCHPWKLSEDGFCAKKSTHKSCTTKPALALVEKIV